MEKIDLKKGLKYLYNPSLKEVTVINVPEMNFLMVDGAGDPNTTQEYKEAVEALYSVSYAVKFMIKKGEAAVDYSVMPLEGLWWADDMAKFSVEDKNDWKWTMMIMQPDYVNEDTCTKTIIEVGKKKRLPALSKMIYESYKEGLSAQIMHIGPYANEGPTIKRMHNYIKDKGYTFDGFVQKHHEVYLSDPRKSAPEKMKTIIRQPIKESMS